MADRAIDLGWEDLVSMLRGYGAFWEIRDATLSPWCDDPDGGELRLVLALRTLVEKVAQLGPDAALSTEAIRAHLARHLVPNSAPPCCTPEHPCEPGYAWYAEPVRPAIVLLDVSRITEDTGTGDRVPQVRIRAIEPILGDDAAEIDRMLRRAAERRTGKTELPLDLEREIDVLGEALDEADEAEALGDEGSDEPE